MYAIKHYMYLHKKDWVLWMADSSKHVYLPFAQVCVPLCVRLCVHVCTMGIVLLRLYFDIWFMLVWNHFHAGHYAIYKSECVVFTEHGDLLRHHWHTKWLFFVNFITL